MGLNKEKLITLVAEIQKARRQLEEYQTVPEQTILASTEKLNSIKYLFILSAEACIDVCQHVSAKLFSETPESYSSCFQILFQHNMLSESLAKRMADLAGLRNLLVHRYWEVDDKRVVGHLKGIGVLDEYAKAIASHTGLLGETM